jgi:hypothetical protein
MPSKGTTTVVLDGTPRRIKEDLAPLFGLKNILSAGLVLLEKLSPIDRQKIIAEAKGASGDPPMHLLPIALEGVVATLLPSLETVFDFNDVVNAGILVFSRLGGDAQKAAIAASQGVPGAQFELMGPEETLADVLIDPSLSDKEKRLQRRLLEDLLIAFQHRIMRFSKNTAAKGVHRRKTSQEPA